MHITWVFCGRLRMYDDRVRCLFLFSLLLYNYNYKHQKLWYDNNDWKMRCLPFFIFVDGLSVLRCISRSIVTKATRVNGVERPCVLSLRLYVAIGWLCCSMICSLRYAVYFLFGGVLVAWESKNCSVLLGADVWKRGHNNADKMPQMLELTDNSNITSLSAGCKNENFKQAS